MNPDAMIDAMIDAIRAEDGDDPELAATTQFRLRRSLESRARGRHQLAGLITAIAILLVGTVSWALATGRITTLWAPALKPRAAPYRISQPVGPEVNPPVLSRGPSPGAIATAPVPALPPESAPPASPRPAPRSSPPAPVHRPARVAAPPAAAEQPVEVLYRRAHELHFHGGDPAAALAAWNAYLAAEPDGRFSVEARYNRAILLVRLGHYAEARAALVPFARGEVEPAGYRQIEAEQLVERLADRE